MWFYWKWPSAFITSQKTHFIPIHPHCFHFLWIYSCFVPLFAANAQIKLTHKYINCCIVVLMWYFSLIWWICKNCRKSVFALVILVMKIRLVIENYKLVLFEYEWNELLPERGHFPSLYRFVQFRFLHFNKSCSQITLSIYYIKYITLEVFIKIQLGGDYWKQ